VSKGSIDGTAVTLEAVVPDRELRFTIRLKIQDDKLVGEFKVEGPGRQMTGKMNLDHVK